MVSATEQKTADQALHDEVHQSAKEATSVDFRNQMAHQTVTNWAQWATVAGFIPVPLLDTAAIGGLQLKMIYDLCKIYEVEFKKELALSIAGALVGGGVSTIFTGSLATTFTRHIPVVGSTIAAITQPALSYGTTYAIGVTFIKHFENKGSLIDFDTSKAKDVFNQQLSKAKKLFKKESDIIDMDESSAQKA
jgi:uncharacterized protein (DUF697 family)